jgi:hypothetical protein
MPALARQIGIDYSGVQTSTASLKGLRVYVAEGEAPSVEVRPQFRCAVSTKSRLTADGVVRLSLTRTGLQR